MSSFTSLLSFSFPQDIEATMNTALSELRELERQSSVKHAPDVVLDTLEQLKSGGASEPSSPLHSRLLREADSSQHPLQRSASSASDMPSTFRPGKSAGPKSPLSSMSTTGLSASGSSFRDNRPPATKPKPVVFPKSSSAGGSPAMGSPTTTIPPTPPPPPSTTHRQVLSGLRLYSLDLFLSNSKSTLWYRLFFGDLNRKLRTT